jgi:transmembrane sensor
MKAGRSCRAGLSGDQRAAMTSAAPEPADHEMLERQARALLMRLMSGEATAADAEAVRQWCGRSAAHAAAFAEANLLWNTLHPAARRVDSAAPSVRPSAFARPLHRRLVLGGAIAAAAGGMAILRPPFQLWPSFSELTADYRTATGEQRQVAMTDGASIELNTATSINVQRAAKDGDRVELLAGEAAVSVGSRPLTVTAGEGWSTAHTAKFNVRREGGIVAVTCLAGEVVVGCRGRSIAVAEGRQAVYDGQRLSPARAVDPAVVTAWRQGMLIFRHEPLARVIAEVNRYRPGRIFLANPALANRTVEASFPLDRIGDVITLVREAFGATVTTLPGGVVVLS